VRIVSVLPHAGGNVPPTLAILRVLASRGHELEVLGHPQLADRVTEAGLAFTPFRHARRWSAAVDDPGVRSMLGWLTLASDRGIGRDLTDAVAGSPADLLLIDCMVPGALPAARAASRRSGAALAVLLHTFSGYWADQWSATAPLGAWLRLTGTHPARGARPDAALLTTLVEFDPPDRRLPYPADRIRQTGPIVDPLPAVAGDDADTVLVSLSTISYPGQLGRLRRIVEALGELPVRAVVTTGPAIDPGLVTGGSNVDVRGFVSHAELMPRARLLVGHGGHGTTMTALAAGVPVLVAPMSSYADHHRIAAAVSDSGAGGSIDPDAPVEEWRARIADLIADASSRERAREVGALVRAARGAEVAADELERLVASRTSLRDRD
jgi:UDP:flavonoid glycosyltransferase YjiC (YdhE family)